MELKPKSNFQFLTFNHEKKQQVILGHRKCSYTMFITALFTTAKIWEQPKCPLIDEWIKKRCDTYIQWNITLP